MGPSRVEFHFAIAIVLDGSGYHRVDARLACQHSGILDRVRARRTIAPDDHAQQALGGSRNVSGRLGVSSVRIRSAPIAVSPAIVPLLRERADDGAVSSRRAQQLQ